MRKISVMVLMFSTGACFAAVPQPTEEESCKVSVRETIHALETVQTTTGKVQRISGLTIADIRRIEAEQGACPAKYAINQTNTKRGEL